MALKGGVGSDQPHFAIVQVWFRDKLRVLKVQALATKPQISRKFEYVGSQSELLAVTSDVAPFRSPFLFRLFLDRH